MHYLFALLVCSVSLTEGHRGYDLDCWQIHGGISASSLTYSPFYDFGITRYHVRNRRHVLRYGLDFSYHQNRRTMEVDFDRRYDSMALAAGIVFDRKESYHAEFFLRIKPFVELGEKIILRRRFSSDLNFVTGLGLNLFHKINSVYYWLDIDGYPVQPLVSEKYFYKQHTIFRRPDVFLGGRTTQYFKIKKTGDLFVGLLCGFNFDFYKYSKNGVCLQLDVGYSFN